MTATSLRTRRKRRAGPAIALATVAFATGAIVATGQGGSPAQALAVGFVRAWTRGDYASMYLDLGRPARRAISASEFTAQYEAALRTATATHLLLAGRAHAAAGIISVPVVVDTRLFGRLSLSFRVPVSSAGSAPAVQWSRSLLFPGLGPGEALSRVTTLPRRATLLARDGSVLAEGEPQSAGRRTSALGEAADAVLGEVGPAPAQRRAALEAQGVPAAALVGVSGLELALDERLRGTPGGELLAGDRVIASAVPHPAPGPVRTTVSPAIQRAAVAALGNQFGGVVAMTPSGEVLAVAGIGLDSLQPPGSTFKMITVSGVLSAGLANRHTVFPYATYSTLDGVRLNNANGEECGGTLETAFAVSCNSVFAPLGAKLGAARLVQTAERFGFNQNPDIPGASESSLPPASEMQGELDVGSTAIGQGEVQASPLEMALVAATVADGGRRPQPTFTVAPQPAATTRAISASVARVVRRLMIDVVRFGTGTAASIPGVTVAGKTGTAELQTECTATGAQAAEARSQPAPAEGCVPPGESSGEASNTDAWFAAFAPAIRPRIVVAVLLVKDGSGGATAAPVARAVLEAGLQASG